MQTIRSAFQECLNEGNAPRLRAIWAHAYPGLPQPPDNAAAEIVLHRARTASKSTRLEARLYSHAWLSERAYPSDLPRELRPTKEYIRPVTVTAICIGVKSSSTRADRVAEAQAVEKVMADAAGEMIRAGIEDRERLTEYMWRKREEFLTGRLRREL